MADEDDLVNPNVIDFRTSAQLRASTAFDDDPEKAARALDQEKAYGIPAQTILGDPEGYDAFFKKSLGNRIIAQNTHLQDFLNDHPVHGAMIHDDLANLDKVSEEYTKFNKPTQAMIDLGRAFSNVPSDIGATVNRNAAILQDIRKRATAKEGAFAPDAGVLDRASELYNIGSSVLGMLFSPITGAATSVVGRPRAERLTELMREQIGTPYPGFELPSQQEAEESEAESIGEAVGQLIPLGGIRLPKGVRGRLSTPDEIEAFLNSAQGRSARAEIDEFLAQKEAGTAPRDPNAPVVDQGISPIDQAIDKMREAEPFIKQGQAPPVGVAPEFDQFHIEAAKADADAIQDLLKTVQETALKERSPEALEQFLASHGDRTIGIQADAVRALYGSAQPQAGDSKLGFIPNLAQQLATVEQYGGDVQVPLSKWLANVDPQVAKDLNDFLRVRPGGMTVEESKSIIGYHGTSADLDQFKDEFIGTGQGAQSFGRGHYIAQESKVAEEYKLEGQRLEPYERLAKDYLERKSSREEAAKHLEGIIDDLPENASFRDNEYQQTQKRALDLIKQGWEPPKGNLYQVKINADPEHFLDWDKPLSEQSEHIKSAIGNIGLDLTSDDLQKTGQYLVDHLSLGGKDPNAPGTAVIHRDNQQKTSALLRAAGIPGIKYLDQGSRTEGEGTRNFVVFDPSLIEITHKNGVPVESTAVEHELGTGGGQLPPQPPPPPPGGPPPDPPEKQAKAARAYKRAAATDIMQAQAGFTTTALARSMTAEMFRKYQGLIAKEIEEDLAAQEKAAIAWEAKQQTRAWKDAKKALQPLVEEEVLNRPEVLAARVLRQIDPKSVNLDDLASTFGYSTGAEMKQEFDALERDRGDLGPKAYENKLVKDELGRQLRAKFGDLSEEITKSAKERVLSPTVMDRIHEEIQAIGMAERVAKPADWVGLPIIAKLELKQWVQSAFKNIPASGISSDQFLAFAGKAGRKAEEALLAGKSRDAFMAKQLQEKSLLLAREALDFEKKKATLERQIKRYSKREVANVDSHYVHQIQNVLQRLGVSILRAPQDLAEQIERDGTGTLPEFVTYQIANGQLLDVADFLLDPAFTKKIGDLTAEEYLGLASTIKIMDHIGRQAEKQTTYATEIKTAQVVSRMRPLMDRFDTIPFSFRPEGTLDKLYDIPASLMQTETLLRHWDHDDPYGPFQRYIIQPMAEKMNQFFAWEKEYGKLYKALGKVKDPDKLVDNPWIKNPDTGEYIKLRRSDVVGILSHWGNESNRDKFLKGWNIISKEGRMEDWVTRQEFEYWLWENTSKEDWERAEAQGKIFTKAFNEISKPVYHRLTGDTPEALELERFTNLHGSFDGYYHPLDYVKDFSKPRAKMVNVGLLSPDFKNMLPTNRYSKARTGYYAPVDIDSNLAPMRLRQMLYDGALREAVVDVNKILKNPSFRALITKHQGAKAVEGLDDWIQFVVNGANLNESALRTNIAISQFIRQNIVSSYVNFNLGTMLKHGPTALAFSARRVGTVDFAKEALRIIYDPRTYLQDNKFAMDSSLELQARQRTFEETLGQVSSALDGGNLNAVLRARALWNHIGSAGVAWSDMYSARNMWKARYKQAFRETSGDHDQAVIQANSDVRQIHGSTSPVALPPAIRNAGEVAKWSLSLYTFFGTRLQRQIETIWEAKEATGLARDGEFKEAIKQVPKIAADLAIFTIFPTMWDAVVSGTKLTLGAVAVGSLISSLPFARDFYHWLVEGGDPEAGLLASTYKDVSSMAKRYAGKTKQSAGKILSDFLSITGAAAGIGGRAFSRPFEYLTDLFTKAQKKPTTPSDVVRGVRFGTSKERK